MYDKTKVKIKKIRVNSLTTEEHVEFHKTILEKLGKHTNDELTEANLEEIKK